MMCADSRAALET
jgi:hypothetical protein